MNHTLQKLRNWRLAPALGAVCIALLVTWIALGARGCGVRPYDAPAIAHTPPTAAPASQPRAAPRAARIPTKPPVQPDRSTAALQAALHSDDLTTRVQALRSVRDEAQQQFLPELLASDLRADPELAPTLIATVASLARASATDQRFAAARQLGAWLRAEAERDAPDARGNMAVLVEQLAQLDSPAATDALVDAIDSDRLPIHMGTLAVQGLARFGGASALPAVEHFREGIAQLPAADSFDAELRAEAANAAELARTKLAHARTPG